MSAPASKVDGMSAGAVDVLALADFVGMDEPAIKAKIVEDFGIDPTLLDGCDIVVAYMSEGDWGCDSGAFIVFRRDGSLYEVNGSHCSCYGFHQQYYSGVDVSQWEPELVERIEVVTQREDSSLACGGYDLDKSANAELIRSALARFGGSQ